MKSLKLLLAITVIATLASSCRKKNLKASPTITTETRQVGTYDGVDVSNAIKVEYTTGINNGVEVEANENLHSVIITEVKSGRLVVKLKNNTSVRGDVSITVRISNPSLNEIDLSGASLFYIQDQLTSTDLVMDCSGASQLHGNVLIDNLNIDMSGASKVDITGTANSLRADISGASNFDDFLLTIDNMYLDISGASQAEFTVNSILEVEASGASMIEYKGNPTISKLDLSGGSSLVYVP